MYIFHQRKKSIFWKIVFCFFVAHFQEDKKLQTGFLKGLLYDTVHNACRFHLIFFIFFFILSVVHRSSDEGHVHVSNYTTTSACLMTICIIFCKHSPIKLEGEKNSRASCHFYKFTINASTEMHFEP